MGAKEKDLIFGQNWVGNLQDIRRRWNLRSLGALDGFTLFSTMVLSSARAVDESHANMWTNRRAAFVEHLCGNEYIDFLLTR